MKKILIAFILLVFVIFSQAQAETINLGVAEFVNRTGINYTLPGQLTKIFADILASYSSNINVISSKSFQALNSHTPEEASKIAKSSGCKYIVLGALINENMTTSNIMKPGLLYSTPVATVQTQTINISVRLIEVDTGKIILSVSGTGSGSFTYKIKEYAKDAAAKEGMQKILARQEKNKESAFSAASSMAAEKISVFLTGEYPEVTSVKVISSSKQAKKKNAKPSTVIINKGTSSGVGEKTFYKIFYEGSEIFNSKGDSIGREKFNLAVAEVVSVKAHNSTANITGGSANNIRKGDKAEQITPDEAQLIIDNNDFVSKRLRNL